MVMVRSAAPAETGDRLLSDDIAERVIDIVAGKSMLERESISVTSTMEDLGIDSLALVELVFAVEEAFDVQVPYNANEPDNSEFDISTVGAVIESVRKLLVDTT